MNPVNLGLGLFIVMVQAIAIIRTFQLHYQSTIANEKEPKTSA